MKTQKSLPLVAALALQFPVTVASVPGTLHLDGLIIVRGDRNAPARVVITSMGSTSTVMEGISRRFELELALEGAYLISFEREGMVTKLVYFDTHVPASQADRAFEFPFQVTLFHSGWNGITAYAGPVGHVRYDENRADFVHRTDYAVVPGSKEERAWAELVAKQGREAPRSMSLMPVVAAELRWERHGKRGGLWVGKAMGADGRLLAQGQFIDPGLTERHGDFVHYHTNGRVESRGRFEHGRKAGVWERFDAAGKPLASRIYDPDAWDRSTGTPAGTAEPSDDRDFVMRSAGPAAMAAPSDVVVPTTPLAAKAGMASQPTNGAASRSRHAAGSGDEAGPRAADAEGGIVPTDRLLRGGTVTGLESPEPSMDGRGRWEELIIDRLRVITVVRLVERTGHVSEYRRVADRHGAVVYFKDGLNIPESVYHAATGR